MRVKDRILPFASERLITVKVEFYRTVQTVRLCVKYDLLFSDVVALMAGLFGFLATIITLEKALLHYFHGDPMVGVSMAAFGLVLFLVSRCFLISKLYEKTLTVAVEWWARGPFILISIIWMLCVAFVFHTTSARDLVGLASLAPWLFSLEAVGVMAFLFFVVFCVPGFAFRPYRRNSTQPRVHRPSASFVSRQGGVTSPTAPVHQNPVKAPVSKLPLWVRAPITVWLVFALAPAFAMMFGQNFLPSENWMASVRTLALSAGVIAAGLFTWLMLYSARHNSHVNGGTKFVTIVFAPFFGYFLGSLSVTNGVPMATALAMGSTTQMTYVVVKAQKKPSRKCGNPVELQGMPFVIGRLCGYPDEFVTSLNAGDEIMVFGRGTDYGLFAKRAGRLKPTADTSATKEPEKNKALSLVKNADGSAYLKMVLHPRLDANGQIPFDTAINACANFAERYADMHPEFFEGGATKTISIEVTHENRPVVDGSGKVVEFFTATLDGPTCLIATLKPAATAGVPL